MRHNIYNEQTGIRYTLQGDYDLPNLTLSTDEKPIGIWGQRPARDFKQYHKVLYKNLLTSGKLNGYLVDIDEQTEDLLFRVVKQMAEKQGIIEKPKIQ